MKDSRALAVPVRVKANVRQQSRSRKRRWSSAIGCIWVLAAVITVAEATVAMLSQPSPDDTAANAVRNGRILQESGDEQCALATFDNDTGRISEYSRRCENTVVLDSHGVPIPLGTIHRLDSIRKSFSGQNH